VALEAMSRGIPTVAFDVGEVAEMLPDRRYGRVVPVNSIMALAGGIDSLLSDIADGYFDPNLLIARHRSLYTSEKMAARIEVIYKHAQLQRSPLSRSTAQQVLASIHHVNKGVSGRVNAKGASELGQWEASSFRCRFERTPVRCDCCIAWPGRTRGADSGVGGSFAADAAGGSKLSSPISAR
jgi:hypothetical protein